MQTRTLAVLLALSLISLTARAADESFVGKWKLNPQKSQFAGLTYKIEDLGGGKYTFQFGDDSENVASDGKEYPTKYGNTWTLTSTGTNSWKFVQKRDGKVTGEDAWKISEDGKTFSIQSESKRPDGTTSKDETVLKRTAGSSGLGGTWESAETKIGSPTTIEIAKSPDGGYSLTIPAYQYQLDFKTDGKEYQEKGPRVAKGTSVSAQQKDANTVVLTYKLNGKTTETDSWQLSADGKTLSNTINFSGVSKPEVDVYDRQ